MRILVCGSRHFDDWALLNETLQPYNPWETKDWTLEIIEGGAKGADFLARVWAKYNQVPWTEYPADWKNHGMAAGPIRNKQMLDEGKPDLIIAFMFKDSRGTKNMVEQAKKAGVETRIINCG